MIRRPPRSTRTDTLFPYTTLFRSSRIEMTGSFGNEMTVPITPLRPFGLDAPAAFVDENRYHQARTWPFERDGNRLLLLGASRRVAPRTLERLSTAVWDSVLRVRQGRHEKRPSRHSGPQHARQM